MTLSIIIVSYNVKYFLEQCLHSVQAAVKNTEAETIVIDNASPDESLAYLRPRFSWVTFIQNETNEGFARANNKALQSARGRYILFLNPDTILAEDTLQRCLFFFQTHPGAGALGVRMVDGAGNFLPESKRSFPSPSVSFYKLSGLSSAFPQSRRFGSYALQYLSQTGIHEVDVIAGAFMMIPKSVLDIVGSFDERFFMYAEDIDLSYRIQKQGYRNYYLGNITIVHFKGESTKRGSLNYVKVFYQAMNLFVKKWYRNMGSVLLQYLLQAGIFLRGMLSVAGLSLLHKRTVKPPVYKTVVLLGDERQTRQAESMIQSFFPQAQVHVSESEDNLHTEANLLVFCIGVLSFQKSIAVLQEQKAGSYKWFAKGSHSIVGSDKKNKSGDVLFSPAKESL